MKEFFMFVGMTLFVGVLAFAMRWTLDKQEMVECRQWKSQSEQFSGFYLAHWQNEECVSHGVYIDTPVRD